MVGMDSPGTSRDHLYARVVSIGSYCHVELCAALGIPYVEPRDTDVRDNDCTWKKIYLDPIDILDTVLWDIYFYAY